MDLGSLKEVENMDSVTHALTGYAISCVLYDRNGVQDKKKLNALKASIVIGAVCPDIDFVTEFFGGNTLYFMSHRTLTHTPIGIVLLSVLFAAWIKAARKDIRFSTLFLGALLGAVSHVLLDITNVYSTLALWPFSSKMYSLGFLAIIDAFLLGVLIFSILISAIRALRLHEKKIFATALILIICYIGFKAYIQYSLTGYLQNQYRKGILTAEIGPLKEQKISVLTDYIGINSWNFIIENNEEYLKGNINYSSHNISNLTSIKKKLPDTAYENAIKTPLGQFLLKFTPYVDYSVNSYNGGYIVHIIDLRYTFPLRLKAKQPGYSHILGAYIILDKNYNPVSWSTKNPLDVHLEF
jgi:inner membrane protein